jgi:hypothetical protein
MFPATMQSSRKPLHALEIERGGIDAVYGFSAGAYTADRLRSNSRT